MGAAQHTIAEISFRIAYARWNWRMGREKRKRAKNKHRVKTDEMKWTKDNDNDMHTLAHMRAWARPLVHSFIHSRLRMLSLSLTCFVPKVFGYVCSFQSIFTCWLNWFCAFILFMLFSLFASRIFARFVTAFIVSTSHTHTRWYGIDVVVCPVFNRKKFWVFWS